MKFAGIAASAALAVLALALPVSPETDQINTRTDYPFSWTYTPEDFPCLDEPIRLSGTYEERLHVVFNPRGGYSWQVHQTTKNMTAVGLTTGETYQNSGPLSYVENGSTDRPWPIEWTFHNINHFVGPGRLSNIYFRTLIHITYDRTTGNVNVVVFHDDVLCK